MLVLALCPLRCNPAEELIQASTTRPARSALSRHAVTMPALRFASHGIAPYAARGSPGTTSAPLFLVLPTGLALCPKAGILESRRNYQRPRQPNLPFCRGSTDPVLICGKTHAVLRGTSPDYGSWSKWAYSSLGSRRLCLGHSVLPLPCENRRLSMGICRDVFFVLPVRAYRQFI